MPTLRDAVKNAAKLKKSVSATRTKRSDPTSPGYFEVEMKFDVTATYNIKEIVTGTNMQDAIEKAEMQFNARNDLDNIKTGKQIGKIPIRMTNAHSNNVIKKSKPQLSDCQHDILRLLDKGLKLYPKRWGNSYSVKAHPTGSKSHYTVSRPTLVSLWRKGFITTPALLMADDDEVSMQNALGTLPKGALVINHKKLEEFKIDLYPKKKGSP